MKFVIAAISLCFCISVSPLAAQDSQPTEQSVRVMSFNIRYGTANDGINHWTKRREALIQTIDAFKPDLLGTQETLAEQKNFIEEKLPRFASFGVGRDDGSNRGEMAALFYRRDRFEKLDGGHFWLSEKPDSIGSKGWDAALPRIATWVKLQDGHRPQSLPILFLNTHFDHQGVQARKEAALLVRRKLQELGNGCELIVTGDFNADADSEPYMSLFAQSVEDTPPVIDTYRAIHADEPADHGTFSGFKADQVHGARIDWIGCSLGWKVVSAGIDRTTIEGSRTPSDHFPVTAVLEPIPKEIRK